MRKYEIIYLLICGVTLLSCEKSFLDKKPDQALLVPSTLTDFQMILDAPVFGDSPGLNEISSGDFSISDAAFLRLSTLEQNAYLWKKNAFAGMPIVVEWYKAYQQVFSANVVLEGLEQMDGPSKESPDFNRLKATAWFYRALAFYELAGSFAKPYDPATAKNDPGIPIRLISDVKVKSKRGTVQETYGQILKELRQAADLLPETTSNKNRPTKCAAFALLSRVYLSMRDYDQALVYADKALGMNSKLLDYNGLSKTLIGNVFPSPLPNGNDEVIFYRKILSYSFPVGSVIAALDLDLYQSYADGDLRKQLFFRDRGSDVYTFRGSYSGAMNVNLFGGLATNELYLNKAECLARKNDVDGALASLNTLLKNRWDRENFLLLKAEDSEECLKLILTERRKELVARGLRWSDLRRLNKDSRFAVTLKREINGVTYQLWPDDNRYVFPLPDNEITGPEMPQNP